MQFYSSRYMLYVSKNTVGQDSFHLLLRKLKKMFQCTRLTLLLHLNLNHFSKEMQSDDKLRNIHRE